MWSLENPLLSVIPFMVDTDEPAIPGTSAPGLLTSGRGRETASPAGPGHTTARSFPGSGPSNMRLTAYRSLLGRVRFIFLDGKWAHKAFDPPGKDCCNVFMLGRVRRTTRLDVGLSLAFAGLAFLVWAFVAGISRMIMREVIRVDDVSVQGGGLIEAVKIFFVDTGFVIDIAGLAWMALSLTLVFLASRQRIIISWAWTSALMQVLVAALGAVLVGWTSSRSLADYGPAPQRTVLETLSHLSLPIVIAFAILIWVVFVIWMLVERARLDRHQPTLTDGMRTNR